MIFRPATLKEQFVECFAGKILVFRLPGVSDTHGGNIFLFSVYRPFCEKILDVEVFLEAG